MWSGKMCRKTCHEQLLNTNRKWFLKIYLISQGTSKAEHVKWHFLVHLPISMHLFSGCLCNDTILIAPVKTLPLILQIIVTLLILQQVGKTLQSRIDHRTAKWTKCGPANQLQLNHLSHLPEVMLKRTAQRQLVTVQKLTVILSVKWWGGTKPR